MLELGSPGENMRKSDWSVSGLCVTTSSEDLTAVQNILNNRPGIEVHGIDPDSGRLVVTQECSSVADHQDGLRDIQSLPGVLTADLVIHYQDPDKNQQAQASGGA